MGVFGVAEMTKGQGDIRGVSVLAQAKKGGFRRPPRPAAAHLLRPGWPGGGRRSGVAGFVLGGRAQGEKAERREDLPSAFPFSLHGVRQVSRPHAAPGSSFKNEKLGPHSKPQLARFSNRGGILGNAPFAFLKAPRLRMHRGAV